MKILIYGTGEFGGTDFLLNRYYEWLNRNAIKVRMIVDTDKKKKEKPEITFDMVVLPSSKLADLHKLKRYGYKFFRILVWIMGQGAFRDSYFNPDRDHGLEKLLNKVLKKEAERMLNLLYESRSICFTDEVGMDNTFYGTSINYRNFQKMDIIPIAIQIPENQEKFQANSNRDMRICWIGRVSMDFKVIPLKHLMLDINAYTCQENIQVSLIVVGIGDGLEEIKRMAKEMAYSIEFVDSVPYEQIGSFLKQHADILIAMGTSALDGAKYGIPSVVITPVRPFDRELVTYRWIFESKGYSLGEYPGIKTGPKQVKKKFEDICTDYRERVNLGELSRQYAEKFDEEIIFPKLINRKLPEMITFEMKRHIFYFRIIKKIKSIIKSTIG